MNLSHLKQRASLLLYYGVGILGLREDDVILTSYPKSGNTWIRFFLCNLISLREWDGKTVTFSILNETMPELGVSNLLRDWPHGTIPRFVKTHKEYWPLVFSENRSVLLVRDPKDVMVSYYNYKTGRGDIDGSVKFSNFIRKPGVGLESWCIHYKSWKDKSDVVIYYEDIKSDDVKEFLNMLNSLRISVEDSLIKEAAQRSQFKEIRKIEKEFGTGEKGSDFKGRRKFTRKGGTGGWKKYFKKSDISYYQNILKKYSIKIYRR